ncbi:diacylglycerol kinase family enzyme [Deinococcus metalli]|uniref:Diacylglycerol kinase n=1 Tax=Deinococcus metalli TaxID=1141878 RepID=A0A7W8NSK2_9DEIO|nr:diacylglycerol kinase family protein [Deinococcus metalli]MBB5379040.1 diacylglycerol kinase family enzyme [Deinococcus metalli]GHF63813.1 diacylglycerol kinase [Deinococcus metalli]
MIPATLIYNAGGGSSHRAPLDELLAALQGAGYDARHRPTAHEDDVPRVLDGVTGPVFVAGGDGTFRAAALALAGRPDVTVGVIPLGTSNNVAVTLGLSGAPLDVARAYAGAAARPFDAGCVTAPWGEDVFFEACGCGVFADVLHAYDPDAPKSPLRAVQALLDTLPRFTPTDLDVTVDGQPHPGPALALLEVMNIRATGNSMRLAPNAHPGDGRLNLIRVNGEQRDSLLAYGAALLRGDFDTLPSVSETPLSTVQIPYAGQVFHVDGETRPEGPPGGTVDVRVWPAALQVLAPRA